MNNFGDKIKKVRLEHGMSQEEFARELLYTCVAPDVKLENVELADKVVDASTSFNQMVAEALLELVEETL